MPPDADFGSDPGVPRQAVSFPPLSFSIFFLLTCMFSMVDLAQTYHGMFVLGLAEWNTLANMSFGLFIIVKLFHLVALGAAELIWSRHGAVASAATALVLALVTAYNSAVMVSA